MSPNRLINQKGVSQGIYSGTPADYAAQKYRNSVCDKWVQQTNIAEYFSPSELQSDRGTPTMNSHKQKTPAKTSRVVEPIRSTGQSTSKAPAQKRRRSQTDEFPASFGNEKSAKRQSSSNRQNTAADFHFDDFKVPDSVPGVRKSLTTPQKPIEKNREYQRHRNQLQQSKQYSYGESQLKRPIKVKEEKINYEFDDGAKDYSPLDDIDFGRDIKFGNDHLTLAKSVQSSQAEFIRAPSAHLTPDDDDSPDSYEFAIPFQKRRHHASQPPRSAQEVPFRKDNQFQVPFDLTENINNGGFIVSTESHILECARPRPTSSMIMNQHHNTTPQPIIYNIKCNNLTIRTDPPY